MLKMMDGVNGAGGLVADADGVCGVNCRSSRMEMHWVGVGLNCLNDDGADVDGCCIMV